MNIYDDFTRQLAQRPEAAALTEWRRNRTVTLSYRELENAAARAAAMLTGGGLKVGDPVLVFVPMSIDLYIALLAIFRLGLVAVFLDPSAGRRNIERCCGIFPPKALIATPKAHLLRCVCPALRRIPLAFTTGRLRLPGARPWKRWKRYAVGAGIAACAPDAPALVTFTSGSTGAPKAAVRSHGQLAAQQQVLAAELRAAPGDLILSGLPIFVLSNLGAGAASLLPGCDLSRPGAVDAAAITERVRGLGVTCLQASPAFMEKVVAHCLSRGIRLGGVRRIFTGGAPVFPRLLDRIRAAAPHAEITTVYGSTEAEPIACLTREDLRPQDRAAMAAGEGLPAGRPVAALRLRILPDRWGVPIGPFSEGGFDRQCLGPGQPGEIVVSGPHVLKGYLHGAGDRETKFRVAGNIWHRTGDAGCVDADGNLWLLGRCAACIRDRQGVLYPFTVEAAASNFATVRRSALVYSGARRTLVVEAAKGVKLAELGLLKSKIGWAQIEQLLILPRIPVDRRHNAKVDYPALGRILKRVETKSPFAPFDKGGWGDFKATSPEAVPAALLVKP
jgi:acyl-CoA synthetase (AMP-forming)/AMP-acid ligase II